MYRIPLRRNPIPAHLVELVRIHESIAEVGVRRIAPESSVRSTAITHRGTAVRSRRTVVAGNRVYGVGGGQAGEQESYLKYQ